MKKVLGSWFLVLGVLLAFAGGSLLLPGQAWATDTVTISDSERPKTTAWSRGVRLITINFSSDDGAIARSATYTVNGVAGQSVNVTGSLVGFHYTPDATNTPDAAADIQVYNHLTGGVNLLSGLCDNVGATETDPNLDTFPVRSLIDETFYFSAGSLGTGINAGVLTLKVWLP
jgi:hypothetical protein